MSKKSQQARVERLTAENVRLRTHGELLEERIAKASAPPPVAPAAAPPPAPKTLRQRVAEIPPHQQASWVLENERHILAVGWDGVPPPEAAQ